MYNFTFHRPTTVRQAAGLLARNPDGKLLAGGHSLLPVMKQRLAAPSAIVDLRPLVEGLSGVELKRPLQERADHPPQPDEQEQEAQRVGHGHERVFGADEADHRRDQKRHPNSAETHRTAPGTLTRAKF